MSKVSIDRLKVPTFGGEDQPPSPDELRQRLDAQLERKAEAKPDNPKLKREYTFPFRLVGEDGRVHEGTFKNRILNVGDRLRAGALAADLVGGRAFEALPGTARQLAIAVSWLTYSLDKKTRPEWAADLSTIDDERLILALYGEAWDHQATFLGRADDAEPAAAQE